MEYLIPSTVLAIIILVVVTIFPEKTRLYKEGFEAGKNYTPTMQSMTDSAMVIYCNGQPLLSNNVKMQRDSVQVVIDHFMGKPKEYLIMSLKLVTKEK